MIHENFKFVCESIIDGTDLQIFSTFRRKNFNTLFIIIALLVFFLAV